VLNHLADLDLSDTRKRFLTLATPSISSINRDTESGTSFFQPKDLDISLRIFVPLYSCFLLNLGFTMFV
jgi:hypothetical protein